MGSGASLLRDGDQGDPEPRTSEHKRNEEEQRDPEFGIYLGPYVGHTMDITDLKFNRDCTKFATASRDKTVRVWDTESVQCQAVYTNQDVVTCVAWGSSSSGTSSEDLLIWGTQDGRLTTCDINNTGRVCDSYTDASKSFMYPTSLSCLDGYVAVGTSRGNVYLCSAKCLWRRRPLLIGAERGTDTDCDSSVAFSPDGTRLAISQGACVKIAIANLSELMQDHTKLLETYLLFDQDVTLSNPVKSLHWQGDSATCDPRLAFCGRDGTCRVFDFPPDSPPVDVSGILPEMDKYTAFRLSPCGKYVACVSPRVGFQVWEIRQSRRLFSFPWHHPFAFSWGNLNAHTPSTVLVTGGANGGVDMWGQFLRFCSAEANETRVHSAPSGMEAIRRIYPQCFRFPEYPGKNVVDQELKRDGSTFNNKTPDGDRDA